MGKISDYETVESPNEDDYLLIDGVTRGTKKILASELAGNSSGMIETVHDFLFEDLDTSLLSFVMFSASRINDVMIMATLTFIPSVIKFYNDGRQMNIVNLAIPDRLSQKYPTVESFLWTNNEEFKPTAFVTPSDRITGSDALSKGLVAEISGSNISLFPKPGITDVEMNTSTIYIASWIYQKLFF